jgi:probable H4MPT-linked C1 transfer pathway protein
MSLLALDIGGANLKAAHSSGQIRSAPFALWKTPQDLGVALEQLVADLPPFARLVVTMTGELCDCFRTKAEGIVHILRAVGTSFPTAETRVWSTDGSFYPLPYVEIHPGFAASNWLALATTISRVVPNGLLIDIGSTTADIIPIRDAQPVPQGRTDTDRLRSGELVYAGVKRTPICALATSLPHQGRRVGLAAELFATTWDVYLMLGDLPEAPEDRSTADGRPATVEFARERLARMIGADRESFSDQDAQLFAREADAALTGRLLEAAERVCQQALGDRPQAVIVSGSGEFLAYRIAEKVVGKGGAIVRLSELWGREASEAACAVALLTLGTGLETTS